MKPFDLKTTESLDFTSTTIESERLILTANLNDYKGEIFREFNDDINKYILPKPARRIEETMTFINESFHGMRDGWNLTLAITIRTNRELLGCCGIHGEGERLSWVSG